MGIDGKPINTITPIYLQGLRKVQGANEVQAEGLPFGKIVHLLQIGYLLFFGTSTWIQRRHCQLRKLNKCWIIRPVDYFQRKKTNK